MSRPAPDEIRGPGATCEFGNENTLDGCAHHWHRSTSFRADDRRRMAWALALASGYMAIEVVGGLLANSLALLADAAHMATDVAALGLAMWAMWLATKPATSRRTYGYHRAEILAALANGVVLVAISVFVVLEAVRRFRQPAEIEGTVMLLVAIGGLAVNGAAVWLLEGGRHDSLNVRAAWLHVLSDALGSIGVVVGAVVVLAFGWTWADPAAACLIAALILHNSWSLLREAVDVLMASAPSELSTETVRSALTEVEGVEGVHDLHVWTLTSGMVMLTAHARLVRSADTQRALQAMCDIASRRFGIRHCTIQPEIGSAVPSRPEEGRH